MDLLNELQSFSEWHPRKNHLYYFAHQHRMTFYHQKTKDDDHFRCSACKLPIEYATYGCPECPTIWLHKSCAELPGEIKKHPFHTQHSLVRYNPETSSDHIRKCSGCDLPFRGTIYGCTECKVFFHKSCLELPQEIKHLRHPSHRLSLKQESGEFWCKACSRDHTGLNYSCERCDYNLGIRCIFEGTTKRDSNRQGHILTYLRKQPSEFGDDFCQACGQRFSSQPIFRCQECRFSLHSHCVLPFYLSLLPPTFQSKSHPHLLTLTNYFAKDFNSSWQLCDICREEIHPTFSFYYCKDCVFAADLTCVLNQLGLSLAHELKSVELGTLPIIVENPSLTVKEIVQLFTEDEMKELNNVVKAAIGEKVGARKKSIKDQKDEGKGNYKAPTYFGQIMEVFESKCGDKKFGLSYYETRSQVTVYNGCTIPKNLEPVLKVLFALHENKDISAESKIKSPGGKTFIFMILCAALYSICTVKEITESQLFTNWDCFKIAQSAGFNVDFAMNRLLNAMHAYLGLGDTNPSDPFLARLDKEMKKISTDMDKLQKTRTQRKTSIRLNSKDGLQGSIEIVGKNSWDEYWDVNSESEEEEDDTRESSEKDQSNMTEEVSREISEQEEEEGKLKEEVPSEMTEMEEEGTSKARDESTREILKPNGEAEEDQTSNTREERPNAILKLEEDKSVGEERSSEMAEPKKDEKKEGEEEKSSTREEMQDQSKLPNPWDYIGFCEQTEPQRPTQSGDQEVENAILKSPVNKIKDFIEDHPSKSLSYFAQENRPKSNTTDEVNCSKCKQPIKDKNQGCTSCSGRVICSWCKQPIKDRNQGCTSCELPRKINCDIHNDTMSLFQGFEKKPTSNVQINATTSTNKQISNKKVVKDEASLCIACELPISDAKNETYHCPKCEIFLHKFCVLFPLQIQHPLHPLHPLELKIGLERVQEIECNVCGEKCRGCAYYGCNCKECSFNLEVRCLFSKPTVQSRCHGMVFCFQEKRPNQSPHGCFACGKKIIASTSSPVLRCAPCNVSLHEQCQIPSPIIRSFHPHPIYFTPYYFGGDSEDLQCDFCNKKMRFVDPAYFCWVCKNAFHVDCAASNVI